MTDLKIRKIGISIFCLIVLFTNSISAQKNTLTAEVGTVVFVNTFSLVYERKITSSNRIDIHAVTSIGYVRSIMSGYFKDGSNLATSTGSLGFTLIENSEDKRKWEFGVKVARINSAKIERKISPGIHFGIRWRDKYGLNRFGLDSTKGIYLGFGINL